MSVNTKLTIPDGNPPADLTPPASLSRGLAASSPPAGFHTRSMPSPRSGRHDVAWRPPRVDVRRAWRDGDVVVSLGRFGLGEQEQSFEELVRAAKDRLATDAADAPFDLWSSVAPRAMSLLPLGPLSSPEWGSSSLAPAGRSAWVRCSCWPAGPPPDHIGESRLKGTSRTW